MRVVSFDIFDTCLIRKCGTPENFFDVFSLRAFNHEPPEWARQEFVAARRMTESKLWEENPYYTLQDIWTEMDWTHHFLKSKAELVRLEQDLEREMLIPVLKMRDKVNECRERGDKIVFISDMYLSSEFLIELLRSYGFYQDGDSLYVSCECGVLKWKGELFEYVRKQENIPSFRHWHHYGDNKQGDYSAPKKMGIKCTLINHAYTPYQQQWANGYSLGFEYSSVLAGLGRALLYSTEWNTHTDFVIDIIAPFYCSLVYRMMKDAEQKGIKRLYFCARDAYMMYKIALQYKDLFPSIGCQFLYISRKALYEGDDNAKIAYYEQEGLATKKDKVGIVDIRSSGKTLQYLNQYLTSKGYNGVRGYYYELFCGGISVTSSYAPTNYYTELSDNYKPQMGKSIGIRFHIFENFFPLNSISKTINYRFEDGVAKPVFGSDDIDNTLDIEKVYIEQKDYWAQTHEELIIEFADAYIKTGLVRYSDDIFRLANDTLFEFLNTPNKHYLYALECLFGIMNGKSIFSPYVKKESWLRLLITRGKDSIWKQGTLVYNNFDWFQKLYQSIRYE